jgi:hypothetical protein
MKQAGRAIANWTGGCSSMLPPDSVRENEYVWGINIVNRGGLVQTRPGFKFLAGIVGTKLQGSIIFTPKDSAPRMLVAVDGYIWVATYPFKVFVKIAGLKFNANAEIINFQRCYKSVKLNDDGSLTLIDPITLVIIQDDLNFPGYYDGVTAKHLSPTGAPFYGAPIGLWMAWAGNRLWIAHKNRVYASDLESPDTFSEDTYIAERSGFALPDICTGLIETNDEKALLAFTEDTTTSLQSNIRDRVQWQQTPNFQRVIIKHLGNVAGKSPVNQYGMTWWMSKAGWVSLDAALYSQQTSKIVTQDDEMMRSKRVLSKNLTGICSVAFENYMLVSVPAGGRYNEQTWVADQTPTANTDITSDMAWCGIWTGTRPVQWMKSSFNGHDRLYFSSFDSTAKDATQIHIWEAFREDRRDNEGGILCQWETGMIIGQDLARFVYAEVDLVEILGDVNLKIYVGGFRGPWMEIADIRLQAEIGSIGSSIQQTITKTSILQAFKPQSRVVKTQDFSSQDRDELVESDVNPGIDKGFQLLFEWRGRMGVKKVVIFTQPDESKDSGKCVASEAGEHNILTDAGETI